MRLGQHTSTLVWKVIDLTPDLEGKKVLDVGCGEGMWTFFLKTERNASDVDGIDIHKPYLDFCRKLNLFENLYEMNLEKELKLDKKYDYIICSEVVEHLEKKSALRLLSALKDMLNENGMLVVTTPTYFFEEGGCPRFSDNIHQKHKSKWFTKDFKMLGFQKIIGYGFQLNNRIFWLHSIISELFPKLGGSFIAIYKKINKST